MASRTRDSSSAPGKERRGRSPSQGPPPRRRSPAPSKASSPARSTDSFTSEKHVPNYLKPTVSSSILDVSKQHGKKPAFTTDSSTTKSNIARRRSFDKPPSPSCMQKSRVSPSPTYRPSSSSGRTSTSTGTQRGVTDKNVKTPKEVGKQHTLYARPVNSVKNRPSVGKKQDSRIASSKTKEKAASCPDQMKANDPKEQAASPPDQKLDDPKVQATGPPDQKIDDPSMPDHTSEPETESQDQESPITGVEEKNTEQVGNHEEGAKDSVLEDQELMNIEKTEAESDHMDNKNVESYSPVSEHQDPEIVTDELSKISENQDPEIVNTEPSTISENQQDAKLVNAESCKVPDPEEPKIVNAESCKVSKSNEAKIVTDESCKVSEPEDPKIVTDESSSTVPEHQGASPGSQEQATEEVSKINTDENVKGHPTEEVVVEEKEGPPQEEAEKEAEDNTTPSDKKEAEDNTTPSDKKEEEDSATPSDKKEGEDSTTPLDKKEEEVASGSEAHDELPKETTEVKEVVVEDKQETQTPPQSAGAGAAKQLKKQDSSLSNDVIEETATKLREQRKNKVKALAGAFETVISLQDHK